MTDILYSSELAKIFVTYAFLHTFILNCVIYEHQIKKMNSPKYIQLTQKPIIQAICLICLFLPQCNTTSIKQTKDEIINLWYGPHQTFGSKGNSQAQINILGNISKTADTPNVYYQLNHGDKHQLTLGCDLHRLANPGDFNIEIYRDKLKDGNNLVDIFVEKDGNILEQRQVNVMYERGNVWPLPYEVNWNQVKNIQDVVEVVDGNWEITKQGIRTRHKYYDRIVAFGDSLWTDYEVTTSVVFHNYTPPTPGPPTYNVSHVAIASRWPGHDKDSLQPNRKWFPLGATSEFRITDEYDSCRWRIFDGENFYAEQDIPYYRKITPGKKYFMKHRVETIAENKTLYSVKLWDADTSEPATWDFQATEVSAKKESGSACLIAHHTDVTFGDIWVVPLTKSNQPGD